MTQEESSSSLYENKDKHPEHDSFNIDTSGSSINLSEIPSDEKDSDPDTPVEESNKSNWTASELSGSDIDTSESSICEDGRCKASSGKTCSKSSEYSLPRHVLSKDASGFVYDGKVVRYNIERGVEYITPLVVGSRKLVSDEDSRGYRSSHLVFDTKNGTLAAGHDGHNKWKHLPKYSLISGFNNFSETDGSFISGCHNKIESESADSDASESGSKCDQCSGSAIVGGNNNTIKNCSLNHHPNAIIGSSNVSLHDCKNTVVVGLKRSKNQRPIEGFRETLITKNIQALGHIHAGPYNEHHDTDATLDVNGCAIIRETLEAETGVFDKITAETINVQKLNIHHIHHESIYLEGSAGSCTSWALSHGDGINVIYCNPVHGPINISLGTKDHPYLEANRTILIKDVTPESHPTSSYNVYISVFEPVRIENYVHGTGGSYLESTSGGSYSLNTSGGAVTFRYFNSPVPGMAPSWIIENQFIGNGRVLSSAGFTFAPAANGHRNTVLKRK